MSTDKLSDTEEAIQASEAKQQTRPRQTSLVGTATTIPKTIQKRMVPGNDDRPSSVSHKTQCTLPMEETGGQTGAHGTVPYELETGKQDEANVSYHTLSEHVQISPRARIQDLEEVVQHNEDSIQKLQADQAETNTRLRLIEETQGKAKSHPHAVPGTHGSEHASSQLPSGHQSPHSPHAQRMHKSHTMNDVQLSRRPRAEKSVHSASYHGDPRCYDEGWHKLKPQKKH